VVTDHVTVPFGDATDACGFPVDARIDGSFKVTDYFDNSGTLLKEIVNNFGGPFTITAVNPANGKSTTTSLRPSSELPPLTRTARLHQRAITASSTTSSLPASARSSK
jgi:hypothetical protein